MDGMRCAGWEVGRGRIRRGGIEEEGRLTVKIPRNVIILCTTRVILRPRRRACPVRSTRVDFRAIRLVIVIVGHQLKEARRERLAAFTLPRSWRLRVAVVGR